MKNHLSNFIRILLMSTKYCFIGIGLICCLTQLLHARESNAQSIRNVEVQLQLENQNLVKAFKIIERSTGFNFVYNKRKIQADRSVSISQAQKNLEAVLLSISEQTGLKFRRINNNISVSQHFAQVSRIVEVDDVSGIVKGKVVDEETNEPLTGATVIMKGSYKGVITDLNGEFTLRVNQNKVDLEVRYLGYAAKSISVDIANQSVSNVSILMANDINQLEGVIVNGNLQGQAKALNQQKSADNIKNIVAADQISRFPDPNVAEALQRIPGVNIERDQGEGRYVFVRGLAPKFTNISVNGEQIPSPEADVRFVALDAVPSDQLSSIEVIKSLTPDLDGDAIGGSVNLITRRAQSAQPDISATLLGGYNELMGKGNIQASLQYGQRFGADEKFGVLVNASYYLTDRGSDNWERAPIDNELELRDYELRRTRLGLSTTLDYKFNERHELYFRALYTKFDDHEFRRVFNFIGDEDEPEIERATKDRYEAQYIQSYNFGGKHFFNGFTLDYEGAYSYGEQDTPDDFEVTFIGEPESVNLDFSNTEFPGFDVELEEGLSDYRDNNLYEFDEFEFGSTLAEDENITGKFNIEIPYSIGNNEASFKFGGKARFKTKSFNINVNFVEWAGDDDLLLSGIDGAGPDLTGGLVDDNFLGGRYQLAANPDIDKVINFYNDNLEGFEHSVEDKLTDEALESFEAEENVYAGYVMTRMQLNDLMLLGGFRYEYTSVNYDSKNVIFNEEGDLVSIEDESGSTDYGFLLPQFHARYALNQNTNLRAAATFSYARPNFSEIVPAQEFNLEDEEIFIGNTELEPVKAFNVDAMAEHYFGTVGILSGGVFYKRLNDFIFNNATRTDNLEGRQFEDEVTVFQAVNGETADLFGFELAYQQNLTFLPGVLRGLGVYANYTYTASEATINSLNDEDQVVQETIDLPGQATHMGNFSLSYQINRFNARLSANFNGEYLSEIDEGNKIYFNDRLQLDFNASYMLIPNLQLFAEVINITDQPFEAYMENEDIIIQREFYSWWSRVGLKFNL